jgi:hypothetical protein
MPVMRRSPIIAQLPFSPLDKVLAYFQEHYSDMNVGIGTASSAGGMAVLEGLVCAIEVIPEFIKLDIMAH